LYSDEPGSSGSLGFICGSRKYCGFVSIYC
jgi:hypothetical protein